MPFTLKSGDEYIFDATQTKETMLRSQVRASILPEIVKALDDAYSTFELMEGEPPGNGYDATAEENAAWETKLDDMLFEMFQGDVVKVVGQHNVGEVFSAAQLWDDTQRRMAAEKLANAIAKHIPITVPEQPPQEDVGAVARPGKATFSLEDVMSELRAAHPDADDLDLYDVLEGCEDSDDLLALSSATRALPANPERLREACRAMAAIHKGGTWIDEMLKVGKDGKPPLYVVNNPELPSLSPEEEEQKFKRLAAEPPKPAAPPSTPASADRAARITDIVARLSKISAHTDQAMAETLGMSRSHFIAVKTGKKTVDWTPQQLEAIGAMAEELREQSNMLTNDLGAV